ncbi:hypothetical protein P692DRAFT_20871831 [Suillus brevipes Sb2]|nr:hypothetical protein P692DRAFT_20871831 [Suillus brevipes Sb2]
MSAATPPDISQLFASIREHPPLAHLSFNNFATFLRRASILKEDILQPQPYDVSIFCAPNVLPPSVTCFLVASLDMPPDVVDVLWSFTKDIVWELPSSAEASTDDEAAFKIYGHELGLTKHVLYPPIKICMNHECIAWQRETLLKKEEPHRIVLFTHGEGAKPGWTVHLRCRSCNMNYQANYSVKGTLRTYYQGIPQFIQVSDHQFVELQLAMQWMDLMQIAVSATNCASLYAVAQARRDLHNDGADQWQFGSALTTEQVWDCFTLLALLDDHHQRDESLVVAHDGDQKNRFTKAMYARNNHIILRGQDELPHACFGCMRIFESPDGALRRTEVIVTDGVTVGRPCCAIPRCKNPLNNNRHRYCAEHHRLETVCAVDGCDQPVAVNTETGKNCKACDDPVHLRMEAANNESTHSGKTKTQRQKIAKLNDAIATHVSNLPTIPMDEDIPLQDIEEWYEHDNTSGAIRFRQAPITTSTGVSDHHVPSTDVDGCSAKDLQPKLKAIFRRQRTNNKQLVVRPCGIISGRGTMYHHEAVSNVLIMVEKMFSLPHARKPQHMIYDSNCNVLREVESCKITFFEGMGMCVDAFHHKTKHKASDVFCRERCDMRAYPELVDEDGKYYFNSSIAEQTNVWFGGFHNICREMTPVKYDFFLMR